MVATIGVLALQGDFARHQDMLLTLGCQVRQVRYRHDFNGLAGLIIPGGESTTISKQIDRNGLREDIIALAQTQPVMGTCAGMILMAKAIGTDQPVLGVMDIIVERNAFGRQKESFEEDLYVDVLENGASKPFHGVFIRSPRLVETKGKAIEIARLADGTPVAAVENKLLATAFHPELTGSTFLHDYFIHRFPESGV